MRNKSKTCEKLKIWFLKSSSLGSWEEISRVLLVGSIMMCILFIYTSTRDLKDSLILSNGCSADAISMLKIIGVLPASIISVFLFYYFVGKFGSKRVFNFLIISFAVFYFIFGVSCNFYYHLQLKFEDIEKFKASHDYFSGVFYSLIGTWCYSLFYISSEVFGALALSSFFWQFASKTCNKDEAKKFFVFYSCIGNLGSIISGLSANIIPMNGLRLVVQMTMVSSAGLLLFFLLKIANKRFLINDQVKEKNKKRVSFKESLSYIFSSKYLIFIALIVICYGVCMHFCEVAWNDQLKGFYNSNRLSINKIKSQCSIFTSVISILITIFARAISKKLSWKTMALATPVIVLFFGGILFSFLSLRSFEGFDKTIFSVNILSMIIAAGYYQELFSRSSKFILFDSTKQMLYYPLDTELKTKGQSCVEVFGGRFGKSLGSGIVIILRSILGNIINCAFVMMLLFTAFGVTWILSVLKLDKMYKRKSEELEDQKAEKKDEVLVV